MIALHSVVEQAGQTQALASKHGSVAGPQQPARQTPKGDPAPG